MESTELNLTGFENWLNQRYRLNTVRGMINNTQKFTEWCELENIAAEKTTYSELISFTIYCTSMGQAKRTVSQKISTLKQFFNYLMETHQREKNPALELRIKNQIRKAAPIDTIKYEDLENIYKSYPAKGIVGKRNKAVLGLMIYQGVNVCELQALEVKDLKLDEGKIYIPATNRSNDRVLKLAAQQIVQLQNYVVAIRPALMAINDRIGDKLFFSVGVSSRLSNTFPRMMRVVRSVNTNVKDQKQIRASVIAHWYKLHNARQVQYMVGHRYVSSTERYRTDKLESLQGQLERMHPTK